MKNITREKRNIDASGISLGRLASQIACFLMGKHKPSYQQHHDMGDFVDVENAEKIKVTGKKAEQKVYYRHSMYPGGIKKEKFSDRVAQKGYEDVIKDAVLNMLPKNKLRNDMMKRLTFIKK